MSDIKVIPDVLTEAIEPSPSTSRKSSVLDDVPIISKSAATAAFTRESIGEDGVDHYRPIAEYEGIHRYDPKYTWEPSEERAIVRKVSIFTAVVVWIV